jgi:hypothetical protein
MTLLVCYGGTNGHAPTGMTERWGVTSAAESLQWQCELCGLTVSNGHGLTPTVTMPGRRVVISRMVTGPQGVTIAPAQG